jgi:uncharacterized protein YjbJ (UPF0337 family)
MEDTRMNENEVSGAVQQGAGKVQSAAGDLLGDTKTQVEGAAREVAGKAQEAYGQAKEVAHSAAQQVGRGMEQQPVIALLVAGVIGYALGVLTARR